MSLRRPACLLFALTVVYAMADPPWKSKQVADWTEDDAKQVLSDSPWALTVTPNLIKEQQRQRGLKRGGIGIGLPGIGMGRQRGGQGGQAPPPPPANEEGDAPTLRLRWESASPIRDAEFKAREVNAPDIDRDSFAVAVYGVPARMLRGSEKGQEAEYKKLASIKREGQKDLKPSSVQVLQRDDGPVIVYLFPRKTEITAKDRRLEFDAQIGQLEIIKAFYTSDMTWRGKLEL